MFSNGSGLAYIFVAGLDTGHGEGFYAQVRVTKAVKYKLLCHSPRRGIEVQPFTYAAQ